MAVSSIVYVAHKKLHIINIAILGCNTAKGAIRSSVDVGTKDENIHLLADLDALSKGVKRSSIESGCDNAADKKSKTIANESADKKQIVNVIQENSVVNEDEEGKKLIIETGKAAVRSGITTNSSAGQKGAGNQSGLQTSENNTNSKVGVGVGANKSENSNAVPQGSAAKTFIASNNVDVNASKRSGPLSRKVKQLGAKLSTIKKVVAKLDAEKSAHIAPSDDAPSMQTGSLSKETDKEEKAATKSTSTLLSPLNSAIKSLDSATKLLGMAASKHAISSGTTAANSPAAAASKTDESTPSSAKVTSEQSAGLKAPSSASNATSHDVTSSTRSAGSSSAKQSDTGSTTKAVKVADPYAEIAGGPDSPKMPDLKTGSEKAGLPVMKIDPSGSPPEPVSFDKVDEPVSSKPVSGGSSSRAGPQDVGGILDQLTDRLNKGELISNRIYL